MCSKADAIFTIALLVLIVILGVLLVVVALSATLQILVNTAATIDRFRHERLMKKLVRLSATSNSNQARRKNKG